MEITKKLGVMILAGGKALRLGGGDKPLLSLGGRTILAWQIHALNIQQLKHGAQHSLPFRATLALNANGSPARFAAYDLPVIKDSDEGYTGPLAGVLAGLRWAKMCGFEALLTVPGDCPFLPSDLLLRLCTAQMSQKKAAICAHSDGQNHFLTCLWDVSCLTAMHTLLEAGEKRVESVLATLGYGHVEWPHRPYDPFLNINTADDVKHAEEIIRLHLTK